MFLLREKKTAEKNSNSFYVKWLAMKPSTTVIKEQNKCINHLKFSIFTFYFFSCKNYWNVITNNKKQCKTTIDKKIF